MVKMRKAITFLMLLFLMNSLCLGSVYAFTDEPSKTKTVTMSGDMRSYKSGWETFCKDVNTGNNFSEDEVGNIAEYIYVEVKGEPSELLQIVGDDAVMYINMDTWGDASSSDVSKVMQTFVDELSDIDFNSDAVTEFMNNFQETDATVASVMLPMIFASTKGNLYEAYVIMGPALDMLSIVLGVGAVILIILTVGSSVIDMAYIGLPMWREAQQGEGKDKKAFGVSYEAETTVKEIEKGIGGDGQYRNAYVLYFKRRALTYIVLSICILYLITGGLSGIIAFILNVVSGITG